MPSVVSREEAIDGDDEQPLNKNTDVAVTIEPTSSSARQETPQRKKIKNMAIKQKDDSTTHKDVIQSLILKPTQTLVNKRQVSHYDETLLKYSYSP